MIAIDSNIFIYALNAHPEFGLPAVKVLRRAETKVASELTFAEILSSPKLEQFSLRRDALDFLERLRVSYNPVTKDILSISGGLRRKHTSLKLADAIHLASALSVGAGSFVTNDQNLVKLKIPGLKIVSL